MSENRNLLAEYAAGSEAAFREIVARYIDLVYSAALRLVNGDTHFAEDFAQTVFLDLARAADRAAILLRFFEGLDFRAVAWLSAATRPPRGSERCETAPSCKAAAVVKEAAGF